MVSPLLVYRLRRNGILIPRIAITRAKRAGLPLADACAILMMETGGGRNIFGHDPTIYSGAGTVTRAKYLAYKRLRGHTRMQGVGAPQLTWYSFQDQADAYGGCWLFGPQLRVAFEHLERLIRVYGEWGAFRSYNGIGVAATRYANTATAYASHFRWVIDGAKLGDLPALNAEEREHDASFDTEFVPLDFNGNPLPKEAVRGH